MAAAAIAVFGLAGCVKGVVGLGLPTVSMALLLLPSLVTNLVQMRPVAGLRPLLQRLGWMQLGIVLGTLGGVALWGGVGSLSAARPALGLAPVMYALWGLTGAITAVTGVFVVPAVAFLQSLGLSRPALMQAIMGLCFATSTLALGAGLLWQGQGLGAQAQDLGLGLLASALMLIPALAGMHWGELLREKLSPELFRKLLILSLLALGVYLCF